MTNASERKGSCLCGAVRITANVKGDSVAACHCTMCRKWGGGPLLAVDCGTDVRIENEAGVAIYPSSAWAERGFCRQCGTHLFYRFKERASYFVPVGVFGDAAPWKLEHQIFIDEKPGFYAFANPTTNMTGAQVFAQFQQQK